MDSKFELFVKKMNEAQVESNEKTADFEVLPTKVSDKIIGGNVKSEMNWSCGGNGGCGGQE